jgi:hypothetical protein
VRKTVTEIGAPELKWSGETADKGTGCSRGRGFNNRKAAIVTLQPIDESGKGEIFASRERRLSRRIGCKGFADAFVINTGYLFRGEIRDISETGCYIMTKARLQLKRLTEVDLLFVLNGRNYRTLARVMEVQPREGVGLEFLFSDQSAQESFKKLHLDLVPSGEAASS